MYSGIPYFHIIFAVFKAFVCVGYPATQCPGIKTALHEQRQHVTWDISRKVYGSLLLDAFPQRKSPRQQNHTSKVIMGNDITNGIQAWNS